jgi:hypothetical protein
MSEEDPIGSFTADSFQLPRMEIEELRLLMQTSNCKAAVSLGRNIDAAYPPNKLQ